MNDTVISWNIWDSSIDHVHTKILDTMGWLWCQEPKFSTQRGNLKAYTLPEGTSVVITDGHFAVIMATDGISVDAAFDHYQKAKQEYAFEPK